MSTFSGLNTALSSLYAQRRGLDLTGQNIANVNTDGYSRQRVELSSVEALHTPGMYSTGKPPGGGVEVTDVTRLHDDFVTNRTRAESGLNEYLQSQKTVYASIEQALGEPSDNGLQSQLSNLWSGWSDVANRPGDASARTQLLSRASTVVDTMRTMRSNLGSLWSATREQVDSDVSVVNQTTGGVADLNERIRLATQASLPTNELTDKRDQLILKLSELTGATSRDKPNGTVDVMLNGATLVSGDTARKLVASGSSAVDGRIVAPVAVTFADNGSNAGITTGTLSGRLEALTTTIPDAVTGLDGVAAKLVQTVNDQHAQGYDLGTPPQPGGVFFGGTDASTISVQITDPNLVAASGDPANAFQGDNATALADLAKDPNGADVTYRGFVVDVGIAAQTVNRRAGSQQTITDNVKAAEQAESGVSLDEEMTNLLQYQRAYEAAAKVITVVDSTLDTLINSMKR